MGEVTIIGLDIAKSVFQAHGVDAAGTIVIQRQIRRGQVLTFFAFLPPCLIGIEACAKAAAYELAVTRLERARGRSCNSRRTGKRDTPLVPGHLGMRGFGRGPFVEGMMASGHKHRTHRSNTGPHRPALHQRQNSPCQQGAVHTWHIP
jgi:hypothetical protein